MIISVSNGWNLCHRSRFSRWHSKCCKRESVQTGLRPEFVDLCPFEEPDDEPSLGWRLELVPA